MSYALIVAILILLFGCAAPPNVTPKPNTAPVITSNHKIREASHNIKQSNQEALKLNQDITGLLDSADADLSKLLGQ